MANTAKASSTILRNTAALALSKLIYRGTTVVLSIVVARSLGPSGLGIYSTALVFHGLVALAAAMGASNYLVREMARDKSRTGDYLFHVGLMGAVTALAGTVVSWLLIPYLGYSPQLEAAVKMIVLALLPGVLGSVQEAAFVAHQRVEFITYTSCISAVVYSGVSILLLSKGFGVLSLVLAFVAMQYVQSAVYYVLIRAYIAGPSRRFDIRFAMSILRDMKAFTGMSILGGLLARPEVILLSLLRNESQVGLYGAALRLVDMWALIPQVYMMNVFPVLSRSYGVKDCTQEQIRSSSFKYLMAVSLPAAVITFAAAHPIVHIFYGGRFDDSVAILRILSVNIVLASVTAVLWRVLAARNEQARVFRIQVWIVVTRISAGYALIALWSALGAAISTTASLGLHAALLSRYVRRDGTQLRLVKLTWRIAVACVPVLVVLEFPVFRSHVLMAAPIALASYVAVLLLLRRSEARNLVRIASANNR